MSSHASQRDGKKTNFGSDSNLAARNEIGASAEAAHLD